MQERRFSNVSIVSIKKSALASSRMNSFDFPEFCGGS